MFIFLENGELNGGKTISEMSSMELALNYKKKLSKRLKSVKEEDNEEDETIEKKNKKKEILSETIKTEIKEEDPPAKPQVTKKRQRKKPRKRKSSYLLPEEVEARAVVERLKKRPQKKTVPTVRINGSIKNPLSLEICQKTSEMKIERALKEFDQETPYACTFCQNKILEDISQYQGVLYGPYKVKDREIWFHDECIVWATGVFLLDNGKLVGLEDVIDDNKPCSMCNRTIASVPCTERFCKKVFHWPCIKENRSDFVIDFDQFIVKCSRH